MNETRNKKRKYPELYYNPYKKVLPYLECILYTGRRKRKYPRPYLSELMYVGSRTIDNGSSFYVTMNDDGFCVMEVPGVWCPEDYFGWFSYWPKEEVWTGSAKTLDQLLEKLAEANASNKRKVREFLLQYFEADLRAYLSEEKKATKTKGGLLALWEKWSTLLGSYEIPGLPSPKMGCGTRYNGLRLAFHMNGWTARLYSDADGEWPSELSPTIWKAEKFDGLFDVYGKWFYLYSGEPCGSYEDQLLTDRALNWNRHELAEILIQSDPRWRQFIESEEIAPPPESPGLRPSKA